MKFRSNKPIRKKNKKTIISFCCFGFFILGVFIGWKNVPGYLKANFLLLRDSDIVEVVLEENNLDTIEIDVKFENLQKIENYRIKALKTGRLISSDDGFVQALISGSEKKLNCKIRLKGDLSDHWAGEKFSLRVEMKEGNLIKGMSKFSLQDPATRNNTAEWLYLNTLRAEGCMAMRYDFVNLIINGKKMGIFAIEEHFSKEMIEANSRREGVIVNYDDHFKWKKYPSDILSNVDYNSTFRSSKTDARLKKRIRNSKILQRQRDTAINFLRSVQNSDLNASEIFDHELLGKFLAITRIWNAKHGLSCEDINFYFNPITCKLEPIGFDGCPGNQITSPYCYFTFGEIKENWVNFALNDHMVTKSYMKHLYEFTTKEKINEFNEMFFHQENRIRNLIKKDLLGRSSSHIWHNFHSILDFRPWYQLQLRAKNIQRELKEREIVLCTAKPNYTDNLINITIRNTTTQPIEVFGFELNGTVYKANDYITNTAKELNPSNHYEGSVIMESQQNGWRQPHSDLTFQIDATVFNNLMPIKNPIYILVRLLGTPTDYIRISLIIDEYEFDPTKIPQKSYTKNTFSVNYNFIDQNDTITIPKGEYFISSCLVVPFGKKLLVEAGVTLLFDDNCTLVSGNEINMIGTRKSPIHLIAKNEMWGGFLLHNSVSKSTFKNVKFSKVRGVGIGPNPYGIIKNGWLMTGGVTIHKSSVKFINCDFTDFKTEDALNIISSNFSLNNCRFSKVYSDAFDGDFVDGNISKCSFQDIGGDGIDLSGSSTIITESSFTNIDDKAISIGENSDVIISEIDVKDVSFGVVVKDLSKAMVSKSYISSASIAAFSAYQKKKSFGPASIRVNDCDIIDTKKQFLIQNGSNAWNQDTIIQTVPLDVKSMYSKN